MTAHLDPNHTAVDLGIIISDWAAAKAFYVDTLGFEHTADIPFPLGDGGVMHRVQAGATTLKLSELRTRPAACNPPGPVEAATGVRYVTFWVTNLDDLAERCRAAGYAVPVPVTTVRPGVRICMVVDPDGNWVEFLQADG